MPKSTVQADSPYPIPEDTLVPVTLVSVQEVDVKFTYKQGPKAGTASSFAKWEWNLIVSDGEFANVEIRGSSEPKITNASVASGILPLALPYVEAFLGRGLELGEEVDTDHLVGLSAQITVKHQEPRPRRDGDGFWFNVEVEEIFPLHPTNGTQRPQTMQDSVLSGRIEDQPPF